MKASYRSPRDSQIHNMANARNKFIRTSDSLSSHYAGFFFFEYFILRGIFFQNRGKNILFGEGNGSKFRPKQQKKTLPVNFYPKPLILTATQLYLNIFFSEITGLFDGLFIRVFRSLDQNGCNPIYGKLKFVPL